MTRLRCSDKKEMCFSCIVCMYSYCIHEYLTNCIIQRSFSLSAHAFQFWTLSLTSAKTPRCRKKRIATNTSSRSTLNFAFFVQMIIHWCMMKSTLQNLFQLWISTKYYVRKNYLIATKTEFSAFFFLQAQTTRWWLPYVMLIYGCLSTNRKKSPSLTWVSLHLTTTKNSAVLPRTKTARSTT